MSWCGVCGNSGRAIVSGEKHNSKIAGKTKLCPGKNLPSTKTVRAASRDRKQPYTRSHNASHWQQHCTKARKPPCTIIPRQQSQHSLPCSLTRRVGSNQCAPSHERPSVMEAINGSRHASACWGELREGPQKAAQASWRVESPLSFLCDAVRCQLFGVFVAVLVVVWRSGVR
jgi:hypothetical protein